MRVIGLVLISSFLFIHFKSYSQIKWNISNEYEITFEGSGAEGSFRGLNGQIVFGEDNLEESYFDITIDPSTISTGNTSQDKHAKGNSWFDVKKYTQISFKSNSIRKTSNGYLSKGVLTLHGVKKDAQIIFTFKRLSNKTGLFIGSISVNREEFGIEGPMLAFMVGDEFSVKIKVPVKVDSGN